MVEYQLKSLHIERSNYIIVKRRDSIGATPEGSTYL